MDRDYIWEGEYGRRSHLIPDIEIGKSTRLNSSH